MSSQYVEHEKIKPDKVPVGGNKKWRTMIWYNGWIGRRARHRLPFRIERNQGIFSVNVNGIPREVRRASINSTVLCIPGGSFIFPYRWGYRNHIDAWPHFISGDDIKRMIFLTVDRGMLMPIPWPKEYFLRANEIELQLELSGIRGL